MNLADFEFAQPYWLLAAFIPLLFLGLARYSLSYHKRLRDYADSHLLPYLLIQRNDSQGARRLKQVWWITLWLLGVLALAGPRWDYETQEVVRPQANLMLLLDLSDSMRVKDLPHSRLEEALQNIQDLLNGKPEVYIGLMVFAGIPHLVAPLSDDYKTVQHLLNELNIGLLPIQGSRLSLALEDSMRWMKRQENHSVNHVLLISDGEFESEDLHKSLQLVEQGKFHLHTLGVGTVQGDFIPLDKNTWQKDAQGNIVISRLNESSLRQLASKGQGIYRHADYRREDTESILNEVKHSLSDAAQDKTLQKLWHERFYLGVIAMLLLILPEFRGRRTVTTSSLTHLLREKQS